MRLEFHVDQTSLTQGPIISKDFHELQTIDIPTSWVSLEVSWLT